MRRGLTQAGLAKALGIGRRAVAAHENGEYLPTPETVTKLSTALGFPEEFFFGDDLEVPTIDAGSFRSMSKMSAVQRDKALSQVALGLELNRWIEARFEIPKPALPDLSTETHPEVAAESLRQFWGIGVLSVRNMIHLLESKGVRVYSLAIDAREVDAFSIWADNVPFVFLNTHKTGERSRFDAAHELAHLVMHKHGPPRGLQAERDANAFASAFLMPRSTVIASSPRFATYDGLVQLKRNWNVSLSALVYRLHHLNLISDWQYRTLQIDISKRGRGIEPDASPKETSAMLPQIFSSLYSDGMSRSKVARELRFPTSELEQLLFGLTITGVSGGRSSASFSARKPMLVLEKYN